MSIEVRKNSELHEVNIKLTEEDADIFNLINYISNKDPAILVKEWITHNSTVALRRTAGIGSYSMYGLGDDGSLGREDPERLPRKIAYWASKKSGVYYFLIKSYYELMSERGDKPISIESLEVKFYKYVPNDERYTEEQFRSLTIPVNRFRRNFRLLCSDAAFGKIFEYNRESHFVTICEDKKDLLDKYKEDWLK